MKAERGINMDAESVFRTMTLREKIGHTVAVRHNSLIALPDLEKHLKENPYGAVWAMGNSKLIETGNEDILDTGVSKSERYKRWFKKANSYLKTPLLVGIDAGRGAQYKISDLSETSNATGIGATGRPELAKEHGVCVASEIRCAGANWWWSPVIDLASRFLAVNIGRAFSDDRQLLAEMACSQIEGIQSQGVAAAAKHFPGPGTREYRDSHIAYSVNKTRYEEWEKTQGVIYEKVINTGVYSIMVGHMAFPAVDDTKVGGNYVPATLSYKIITGLLKNKMKFNGVVITDAIGMAGLSTLFEPGRLYVELLKAGNDVVLGPTSLDYIDVVGKAVLEGELPEERVNDACMRVLALKEKLGLLSENYQDSTIINEEILGKTRAMNRRVAENAVTLVCDKNGKLPISAGSVGKVAIICSAHTKDIVDRVNTMKVEFEKRGAVVNVRRRLGSDEESRKIAEENDLIIYAAFIGVHA
ncbi:MAG: glycoside hydrolase family 3 N-terminal domain-containing protein, partial [Eubacteriales bacterium]|nr:glycoside hydrolase family 3 N-terminal domain-containing protein [Eubacteriales bacterium]